MNSIHYINTYLANSMLYPVETHWELNVLFHEFPYNLNMNGVEVGVYLFFKECCFRVRATVTVDTNPNPNPK